MDILAFVIDNGVKILEALTMLVGAFALIATITPTEADNEIADKLAKAIHFLGANFGKARR